MPTHSDDRMLWILIGLCLIVAAKAVPASLQSVRQITEVKGSDETPPRTNEKVEHLLKIETLEKLIAGRSYEIRSSAIKIIAERCITGPALISLLEDLASRDSGRRDKAILALQLFISHRSVQSSPDLALFTTIQAFHAMITALVNLLTQHECLWTSTDRGDEGKVECYQRHYGLPFLPPSRYETYQKQAEEMADGYTVNAEEKAVLSGISAQKRRLLAMTGFTPLTEYFFNGCAYQQFLNDKAPLIPLDGIPGVPDVLRPSLMDIFCSAEAKEGLSGWQLTIPPEDRIRHIETMSTALWSCRSTAVQSLALRTAISTEREALTRCPDRKIYDAYCQERADHFRQLKGGLFQHALQSSSERTAVVGRVGKEEDESIPAKRKVLPPSPVLPARRHPQERNLLLVLIQLLEIEKVEIALSTEEVDKVEMALSAGLVSRWLYRYPFPCNLASPQQQDIVAFLRLQAWGSDDPLMAKLVHIITSVPSGLKELREFGLTKITSFHNYWHGGDWYAERPSTCSDDVVMAGGEDTAGVLPATSPNGPEQRPGSSWSRRHPILDSQSYDTQRRRRREAMVLSDGDGPLTEGNILQRENSQAALVPGHDWTSEERPAPLTEEMNTEREDPTAVFQTGPAYRQAIQGRPPLADITGVDDV